MDISIPMTMILRSIPLPGSTIFVGRFLRFEGAVPDWVREGAQRMFMSPEILGFPEVA